MFKKIGGDAHSSSPRGAAANFVLDAEYSNTRNQVEAASRRVKLASDGTPFDPKARRVKLKQQLQRQHGGVEGGGALQAELEAAKQQVEELKASAATETEGRERAEAEVAAAREGGGALQAALQAELEAAKQQLGELKASAGKPATSDDLDDMLITWLEAGGTAVLVEMAGLGGFQALGESGCEWASPDPLQKAAQDAVQGDAAALPGPSMVHDVVANVVSAALKELSAGRERASSVQPSVGEEPDSDTEARESYLRVIDNKDAREWWSTYVHARVASYNAVMDALTVWMCHEAAEGEQGRLKKSEASIVAATVLAAIDRDGDGEVTFSEWAEFTSELSSFSVGALRAFEVPRGINPTDEEINEHAEYLGIDTVNERELLWIAERCMVAPLPRGWAEFEDDEGSPYFHHEAKGETAWSHPLDAHFKALVQEQRSELAQQHSYPDADPSDLAFNGDGQLRTISVHGFPRTDYFGTWTHDFETEDVWINVWACSEDVSERSKQAQVFRAECALLHKCEHPCIINLKAATLQGPRLIQVLEPCRMSVQELLRDNLGDSANISLGKRLQISHDVSSAIGYLHDGSEPQTHQRLCSANVFMHATNGRAKLGVGRVPGGASMDAVYLAPELLSEDASDGPMSAADMYALGMFLWEVFAEDRPFQGVDAVTMKQKVQFGERPVIPAGVPTGVAELIADCWHKNIVSRPSANLARMRLEDELEKAE